MREYETEDLRRKIDGSDERFVLLDVLPRASYANRHLPGAVSLPLEDVEARASEVIPDRDVEVVTYCSGPT